MASTQTEPRKPIPRGPLFAGIAVVAIAAFMAYVAMRSGHDVPAVAQVQQAPTIRSVPGGRETPEYKRLMATEEAAKVKTAEQTGKAAVPTLASTSSNDDLALTAPQQPSAPPPPPATASAPPPTIAEPPRDTDNEALRHDMSDLIANWTRATPATTITVAPLPGSHRDAQASASGPRELPKPHVAKIPAATILYAVLNTAINTDSPGAVLASVAAGPYRGARLLGAISRENDLVVVKFTTLTFHGATAAVEAVAIDPMSTLPGLATDVNHHYLMRYGSLMAAAFLQGYGQAQMQAASTVTQNPLGGTTAVYQPSSKQIALSALGQVGQTLGEHLGGVFNTPTTVKVDKGAEVGVLFLKPLYSEEERR